MLLAGFLFPVVLDTTTFALTGQVGPPSKDSSSSDKMETIKVDAIKLEADEQQMDLSSRLRLIFSVLVGDSLHNLCDGFFIGAGFRYCGDSRGWSIAAASIIHEIAQELSDYTLLTGKVSRAQSLYVEALLFIRLIPMSQGKLPPFVALALNFLSGLSTLLGVLIILSVDISGASVGLLLSFSGGVFIHIACVEAMPVANQNARTLSARVCCVILFVVGAVAIGLVLLDHSHCTLSAPSGDGSDSHGHDHGSHAGDSHGSHAGDSHDSHAGHGH